MRISDWSSDVCSSDLLVAPLQPVIGKHRRNGHGQTKRGHDERFTNRPCDRVDRSLTGCTDLDECTVNTDNRTKKADERRGRAHGRQERQTGTQLGIDGCLRTGQGAMQPIMRFDWISQLAVLLLGRNAVIDQLLRSEEHTSELQSLMRISYAVFCLK